LWEEDPVWKKHTVPPWRKVGEKGSENQQAFQAERTQANSYAKWGACEDTYLH